MTILRTRSAIDAHLVHHTGSMIRFTTRQLPLIPQADVACDVFLPDGQSVKGQWHPHPQNPYLAGRPLVHWIKSWVPYGTTVPVRIHPVGTRNAIRVELVGAGSQTAPDNRENLLKIARQLAEQPRARRRVRYERWERDPSLRSLMLGIWGTTCQIQGCTINDSFPSNLATGLVDVHHLNHVGTGGSDSPLNLSVLCVSHHHLLHRAPTSILLQSDLGSATIQVNGLKLRLKRDVSGLMAAIGSA